MKINEPVFFPLSYTILWGSFTKKTLKNSVWLHISGAKYPKDKRSVKNKTKTYPAFNNHWYCYFTGIVILKKNKCLLEKSLASGQGKYVPGEPMTSLFCQKG